MFWIVTTIAAALLSGLAGWHIGGHPVALAFTVAGALVVLGVRDLIHHKHAIFAGTILAGIAGWYLFGLEAAVVAALLAFPLQIAIHDFTLKKHPLLPIALTFAFAGWWAGWHYFNPVTGLIFALLSFLTTVAVDDYFLQRAHIIRRNFPLIGWFRYGFELIGDELRQYWFMSDTEERPYNRETRRFIYRSAKGLNNNLGFGTSRSYRDVGEIHILNAMFPVPETTLQGNRLPPIVIGKKRGKPYVCPWPINISGMSWGSLSEEAVRALSSGARVANVHILTGEGGLTPFHVEGVIKRVTWDKWCAYWTGLARHYASFGFAPRPEAPRSEVVGGGRIGLQLGPAKFGFRRIFTDVIEGPEGRQFRKRFSDELDIDKLVEAMKNDQIAFLELKGAQGAKPGQGGKLPKEKITPQLAQWRGIPEGEDCYSPNAWSEFDSSVIRKNPRLLAEALARFQKFLREVRKAGESTIRGAGTSAEFEQYLKVEAFCRFIQWLREKGIEKPIGFKTVVGQEDGLHHMAWCMKETGDGPDFVTIDGGEGGTGAAPAALADRMGLPILHSIPIVDNIFRQYGVRDEIVLVASGQIARGDDVAIAIAMGADMVNIARGNLIAEGCIMAKRCHTNTCPVGIATQDPRLRRGLDPQDKYVKVANYNMVLQRELLMILKACGVRTPWELTRHHLKVVVSPMVEKYMDEVHPYPDGSDGKRHPTLGELPPDDPEFLDRFGPKLIKIGLIKR